MSERPRKRRGPLLWLADRSRRFWIIAALLPFAYVALFGPACWITSRMNFGAEAVQTAYRPMTLAMSRSHIVYKGLQRYARLGAPRGWMWIERIYGDWVWVGIAPLATDEELDFWDNTF